MVDTARHLHYTSRAKREATSRCRTVAPWSTTIAPWSTTMRRVFHPETNGVKASPHQLKWMLSRGALAAPSDPWNFDASDVPPRQNGQRVIKSATGKDGGMPIRHY